MMKEARFVRAISLAGVSLLTLLPAVGFADTDQITTTPGQTQTQSTVIGNTAGTTTTVDIIGGGTEVFGSLSNTFSGGLNITGNTTLSLSSGSALGSGMVTLGGGTGKTATSGSLNFNNTSNITVSQNLTLSGNGGIFDLTGIAPATSSTTSPTPTTVTWTGTITGTGPLILEASGTKSNGYQTLILTGENTSTGPTIIESGILELGAQGGLYNGTLAIGTAGGIVGTGVTIGTNGSLNLDGFSQSLAYLNGSGSVVLGAGTLTLDDNGSKSVYDGEISGTGGLTLTPITKAGTVGHLTLTLGGTVTTGNNTVDTYTGSTVIGQGATLLGGSKDAFSSGSTFVIGDGGTVDLNGFDQIIGGLSDLKNDTGTGVASLVIGKSSLTVGFDNASTIYSGNISGTGTFTKDGTGLLVLEGANLTNFTGNTVVTGGQLDIGDSSHTTASLGGNVTVDALGALGGYGTIGGSVTNGGVVAPGGKVIGNLTIDGSYTQSSAGTLAIRIGTTPDQLVVDGKASIAGTLDLVSGFGKLTAGNHDYEFVVDESDDLTGTFTKIDGLLDAGYAESVSCVSTGCTLSLTQLKTLNENASIYPALMTVAIDDVEHSNGMAQTRLNDARLSAVVDGMWMSTSDSHQPGANSNNTPYGLWGDLGGTFNTGVSGNGAALPGFSASGATTMSGVDGPIDKNVIGGVAAGYSYLNVSQQSGLYQKNGASGQINAPHVSAYASYWTGPVAFDAILGVGYASLDATRSVSINDTTGNVFSSLNASATSSHSAIEVGGAVQASSAFPIGGFGFSPAIGVQYANVLQQGFTEAGAGGFDVATKSNQNQSLRPYVSFAAATKFETETFGRIEPQLKVAYSIETMNPGKSLNVTPVNDVATFVQQGLTASRSAATVGAGVNIEVTRAFGYNVEYESSIGVGNTTSQAVDAGVHYRF